MTSRACSAPADYFGTNWLYSGCFIGSLLSPDRMTGFDLLSLRAAKRTSLTCYWIVMEVQRLEVAWWPMETHATQICLSGA